MQEWTRVFAVTQHIVLGSGKYHSLHDADKLYNHQQPKSYQFMREAQYENMDLQVALLVSLLALCHLNVVTIYCNLVNGQGLLLHVHVPLANHSTRMS